MKGAVVASWTQTPPNTENGFLSWSLPQSTCQLAPASVDSISVYP